MAGWFYILNGEHVDWPNGEVLPSVADVYHVDFVNQFHYALAEREHVRWEYFNLASGLRPLIVDDGWQIKVATTDQYLVTVGQDAQQIGWINEIIDQTNRLKDYFILPDTTDIQRLVAGDRLTGQIWTNIRDRINSATVAEYLHYVTAPGADLEIFSNALIESRTLVSVGSDAYDTSDVGNGASIPSSAGNEAKDAWAYAQSIRAPNPPYFLDQDVYLYGATVVVTYTDVADNPQTEEEESNTLVRVAEWAGYSKDCVAVMGVKWSRTADVRLTRYAPAPYDENQYRVDVNVTSTMARNTGSFQVGELGTQSLVDNAMTTYDFGSAPNWIDQFNSISAYNIPDLVDFITMRTTMTFTDFYYR